MKKFLGAILLLLTVISSNLIIMQKSFAVEDFKVMSKAAYQIEANTGTVIYAKNENEHLPIASMCKIMTQLLCFEEISEGNLTLDEEITVSANAAGMGGSQVFLDANGKYKVDDLMKSIAMASANDACVAMAERISGSVSSFVDKMNEKAQTLGMDDTVFVNCTGLPAPNQYSSAKDVAKMFSELIKHKDFFKYSTLWTDEIKHAGGRVTGLTNTNKLVRFYKGCDCGKTGYTSEAGHCLCASAKRDSMRLITVVIGAPDSKRRFFEVSTLFDNAFNSFCSKLLVKSSDVLDVDVEVKKGEKKRAKVRCAEDFYYFCNKNEKFELENVFDPISPVKAPLKEGDVVGKLTVFKDGKAIGEIDVVSAENIGEKTYWTSLKEVINGWKIN